MTQHELDLLLVQIQFPAMTYVESQITRHWIRAHGLEYDKIEFNVRLGEGVNLGEGYSDATRRAALLSSQKRADIVAWRGDRVDLVEVKVRINLGVIGQLLGYETLWNIEHAKTPVARKIAIGRSVLTGLDPVIRDRGIEIEVFPFVRDEFGRPVEAAQQGGASAETS